MVWVCFVYIIFNLTTNSNSDVSSGYINSTSSVYWKYVSSLGRMRWNWPNYKNPLEKLASTMPSGEPIGSSSYSYYKWIVSVSENIFWTSKQTINVVNRFDMDSEYNTFRLFRLAARLKGLVRETWCQITDEGIKSDLDKWYVKNLFILFIIYSLETDMAKLSIIRNWMHFTSNGMSLEIMVVVANL